MKKFLVIVAGMGIVLAFSSCKSKESAYRQAYDKAKAQEAAITTENNVYEDTPEVTPFVDTPYIDNTGSQDQNYDNVPVRQEDVSVVGGGALKAYSVVVGSFSVKSNAVGLVSRLRQSGYNSARNMYRVVATTYNDKGSAVQSRTKLRGEFPDAWLLYYGR